MILKNFSLAKNRERNSCEVKGFTLIELLVVIAIIGILSTLAVVSMSDARAQARDARRAHDLRQVQTAVELYKSDNVDAAPATTSWSGTNSFETDLSPYLVAGLPDDPGHPGGGNDLYIYCARAERYALIGYLERENSSILNGSLSNKLGYNTGSGTQECVSSSGALPSGGLPECGKTGVLCLGSDIE